MNIQSFDPTQPLREPQATRPAATSPTGELPAGAHPEALDDRDTASISAAAVAAASGVSDVRTEKVAAIQQQLASGSYSVAPAAVADKLIEHLLQG